MPLEGAVENAYGRVYRYIKPNSTDPGTWRLATPEQQVSDGGGGGGGTPHDIDGTAPIKSVTVPGNPRTTTISLDITVLSSRV